MRIEDVIEELHAVAGHLGVTVRYDRGDFEGGYCIVRKNRLLLVNRRLSPARKAAVLALGLNDIGLESAFVKPAVRAFIEDEVAKASRI